MAAVVDSRRLSDALVSFSLEHQFPDDVDQLPPVSEIDLEPAIAALAATKNDLEVRPSSLASPCPLSHFSTDPDPCYQSRDE